MMKFSSAVRGARFAACLGVFSCLMGWSSAFGAPANVILLLADDQGWGDIGSHGHPVLETPVLDELAAGGARFESFIVEPLCAPTRAAILTGRYPARTGCRGVKLGYESIRASEVTIAEAFSTAGFATGCFGKWHSGNNYPYTARSQGFDKFFGFNGGGWDQYFSPVLLDQDAEVQTDGFITDVLVDEAIKFIRHCDDKPFFCYVPFNVIHGPHQAFEEDFQYYIAKGCKSENAANYAMLRNLDANIGRLLHTLQELELDRNTIVCYLSDNGPAGHRFNGGLRGTKGSLHEGGTRVPCFIRWPEHIPAGLEISAPAAHIDLFPTFAELTGVALPENVEIDGRSLTPLLLGKTSEWNDDRAIIQAGGHSSTSPPATASVRTKQYRLFRKDGGWELYDLWNDPGQQHNIADQQPETTQKLSSLYEHWYADVSTGIWPSPPTTQIGFEEAPETHIIVTDCTDKQGAEFYRGRWRHSWICDWDKPSDFARWPIDVVRSSKFEIDLKYALPAHEKATVQVEFGDSVLEASLEGVPAAARRPINNRIPWIAELPDRNWATMNIGTVSLPKGPAKLTVRVSDADENTNFDLKGITIRMISPAD